MHRLATVQNADHILVVDDGKIAKCGTHDELIQREGLYKKFTEIRELTEDWRIAAEYIKNIHLRVDIFYIFIFLPLSSR